MHELSIVESIVDTVTDSLVQYPGARVLEVRLRVGALSAVVEESLTFCWDIAIADTPLAGARLAVQTVPVRVHCGACGADEPLESLQSFCCARCGAPANDVRQGRELEIEAIEIEEAEEAAQV